MANSKQSTKKSTKTKPPATTPEAEEKYLISLAYKQARIQLENGTASSQIINHFLTAGSKTAKLEQEKKAAENELLKAKTEHIANAERTEEMYEKAIRAMKRYQGVEE